MDSFESISKLLLEEENYWVRQSFKVNLTKEEKRQIGKHSIPRPEIDLIAFNVISNEILAIEVKSFLDSPGVMINHISQKYEIPEGGYKLLTCTNYRKIVFKRLKKDLISQGLANKSTKIRLGFIAGHVYKNEIELMSKFFDKKKWFFWGPDVIKEKLLRLAKKGYENNSVVMAAKILNK